MESKNIELTDALNELIQVNNSRVEGYENALEKCKEDNEDLQRIFSENIMEAREHVEMLKNKMIHFEAELPEHGAVSHKITSIFKDLKWMFTSKDREAILETCSGFETEAIKAYEEVLSSDIEMGAETRQSLISQKEHIQKELEQINSLRNEFAE
jgi:uncharacterized protein (TIGR02284 family)